MPSPDPPILAYREGRLCFDGRPITALAEELETPFFLVSERRLRANAAALRRGFAAAGVAATLRYCAKTNHEAGVLEILAAEGCELLAAHAAEVELGLRCGFPPSRIAFQRPVPGRRELAAVVAAGVGLAHLHRPQDLPLLEEAAGRAERRLPVSLRLRTPAPRWSLSPLDHVSRRLGLHPEQALAVAGQIGAGRRLELAGLNAYIGTQQASPAAFARSLDSLFALVRRLRDEHGAGVRELNLGGGIPSPSIRRIGWRQLAGRCRDALAHPDRPGDLEEFARRLGTAFRSRLEATGLDPAPVLVVEPGRPIVGNAAVLVTRVGAVDGRWAFVDASRNHLAESPLLFNRRLLPAVEPGPGPRRFYHLSGSTLNTLDVVDLHRRLPPPAPGDLLVVGDAGAYTVSRASRYAGLTPAVYLLAAGGALRQIRRPEGLADLTSAMCPGEGGR